MTNTSEISTPDMSLLEKAQALVEIERSLTVTMEKVEPWLRHNTRKSKLQGYRRRVRPIPTTMEEVKQVLAVARNYSSRTSAPAGWNPAAPVMGFATPNPLPHQLRGGALAALQLERARQEERSQKRKRAEEEEEAKAKKMAEEQTKSEEQAHPSGAPSNPSTGNTGKPSAKVTTAHTQDVRRAARPQPQVLATTMNLSDSSSSEESDDE